jgi:hypothetical protein
LSYKRTLFFLATLALLAGTYFLHVQPPARGPMVGGLPQAFTPDMTATKVLPLETGDEITGLSLYYTTPKKRRIALQREVNKRWQVTAPVVAPAESMIVEGIASLLTRMNRERVIPFQGLSKADFGFEAPGTSVCVTTSEMLAERCLAIGDTAAIGDGSYVKWNHEDVYFVASPNFVSSLEKTLYSVRKKQVFSLLREEIASIQMELGDELFVVRKQGEDWKLVQPTMVDLNADKMHELLTALNSLYVKEFIDAEPHDTIAFGVFDPARRVRIYYRDGTRQTLAQGEMASGRDSYYVETDLSREPVLISKGRLDALEDLLRDMLQLR